MQRFEIECLGLRNAADFWQRYVDVVSPHGADMFGRNLDAFADALEGGPGWPGENVELAFLNSQALAQIRAGDGATYLDHLGAMAREKAALLRLTLL